jgi:peroxiredoxin Q/BCP
LAGWIRGINHERIGRRQKGTRLQNGGERRAGGFLSQPQGHPKADTPGCTKQACGVQEALPQLGKLGLTVIGVSPDAMPPIEKFAKKYGLEFPLASDPEHKTAEAYGVWVEKSMYGKKYMGMERSSFLVAADGKIAKIWRKVKPEAHAAEVLAAAKALG